jgi:hypothetical protein
MKIKKGVILSGLQLPMRRALKEADELWKKLGQELVITAGLEGEHSAGSLHYYGYAFDCRTRYFDQERHRHIAQTLRSALGGDYDVVVHKTHIHVEYNRAKKL